MKKVLLGAVAVFVAWFILDYIIHQMMLSGIYEENKALWRPMEEVNMVLGFIVSFLSAFFFTYAYYRYVDRKNFATGAGFGLVIGLIWGISWGYGTYVWMPIPYSLAISWFFASVVEVTVAGMIIGLIMKEKAAEE